MHRSNLDIPAGQTVALVGPNGAGKSTTVNPLLGLLLADRGTIEVFDRSPRRAAEHGLVGTMLQDSELVPSATVREVVDFVRRRFPHPLPLHEVPSLADLTDIATRRTHRLSGDQAQRARFALAVAGKPDLLLLDEPTVGMDVAARRDFWAAMRRYAAAGHTVLFTTHYLEEADANADRIVVIAHDSAERIRAATGVRTLRFARQGQPATGLDALPGVTAAQLGSPIVRQRTRDQDATLHALFATGLEIHDLTTSGANLENAFLALTDHKPPPRQED